MDTDYDEIPVGEANNFSLIFGDCARTRVMYVVFFFHDRAITKTELAKHADVSRPTVYEHIPELIEMGIVTEDDDGRVRVNKDSEFANTIAKMEWDFIDTIIEAEKDGRGPDEYLISLGDTTRPTNE